ncbi:hypothetical protein Tco_0030966 [Tanacetum coccineum]
MEEEQNQPEVLQELLLKLINDLQILKEIQQEKKKPTAQSSIPYWNSSMIDDEEARDNFLKDEPDNSLSMGDEHLDIIPSVENLAPIPSEFEGISDNTCDVPVRDDSSTFDALNDNSEILSNSNDDDTSSDDDDFEDVEYVSLKEIEPDQEGLISIDNSNDSLLEILEFESFYFDAPSFPRSPPEPPDVEICLHFEHDAPVIDNFNELNDDQRGTEIDFSQNVEDTILHIVVGTLFSCFLTYPVNLGRFFITSYPPSGVKTLYFDFDPRIFT